MAMDFFKKFKKSSKKEKTNENENDTGNKVTAELNPENVPNAPPEAEIVSTAPKVHNIQMMAKEDVDAMITKRFDLFNNSPLKILWNIFYAKEKEAVFDPMQYVYKPLIETNIRLNELNYEGNDDYMEYDHVQKDFMMFVEHVQGEAVKTITELMKDSVEEGLDSFSKDIDMEVFERRLSYYCRFNTYGEMRYDCEKDRSEVRKKPMDCQMLIGQSKDKIHGWIIVFPPINGGSHIREDDLKKALDNNKIISGVNTSLISAIVGKKKYLQIFEIARGTEPVHGKDGYIIDKFPRKNIIRITENENGSLNYKELNNVKSIHKGTVITEIFYPVEGSNGKAIDGKILNAHKGVQPKVIKGKNTYFTEDKSQLCADKDGELVFKDGAFHVNELLTIQNDVDNASGNINFSGDVLIKGDVREGFSVKAEGDITIEGTCEGAHVEAEGNINIVHGMTGGGKGVLKAGGNIKCLFLENCSAFAKGTIEVDQVMYSELSCSDSIVVSGKKGSVTGGKLIAGRTITAGVIGAASNPYLKTEIVLGATPDVIRQYNVTGHNLKDVSDKLFKVTQDINYIEANIDRMPKDRLEKLKQLKIQEKYVKMQKATLEETLTKLTDELEETKKTCSLKCAVLNPTINFKVGEGTYTLTKPLNNCSLFVKENSAVITSTSIAENIIF